MTKDIIKVQYPVLDHSESIANIKLETTKVNPENGITIADAFGCHHNCLFIHIMNFGKQSLLTIKAGNSYPNSMLGDIVIEIPNGVNAISLQDLSRFEKEDGSLDLDFESDFDGAIYAVARWAGVRHE